MKKYFLFDLDGTLTDTGEGIMSSAQYALDFFGIHNEPKERLRRFVGPPLDFSFENFYGLSNQQAWQAIEKYRERYRERGVFESPLYDGIRELLEELAQRAAVCLATSKPMAFAEQILKMRGIEGCFSVAVGAELDGTRTDKAEVIGEVLRRLNCPPTSEVIMIGDRRQDVLGAKTHDVDCIGVMYGYSEQGELAAAGAQYIVSSVDELRKLCIGMV